MRNVIVVGGGFTGLAAALELQRGGARVTVLEALDAVGGLAGSFEAGGARLEKFYHHWFTNDTDVQALIGELGLADAVQRRHPNTGVWYANHRYRLSTPLDLLRFAPLSMAGRLRLAWLTLRARKVKDWMKLESITASQWLQDLGGNEVYRVLWEPLLRGKFGDLADQVSAVWMWNKLVLRGGSRGKGAAEELLYLRGGFARLADAMVERIRQGGGEVRTSSAVQAITPSTDRVMVQLAGGTLEADAVLVTTAIPQFAAMITAAAPAGYLQELAQVQYLANTCLVLSLDRSLSETYWLNVNDPTFPFVGIIEHTNLEPTSEYAGQHIVYLSKYLRETDALYALDAQGMLDYCMPYLKRVFPEFDPAWVRNRWVWRARYAQPVVTRGYSKIIPAMKTPLPRVYLATMAQIYPQDRGTNYAVRSGREAAGHMLRELT